MCRQTPLWPAFRHESFDTSKKSRAKASFWTRRLKGRVMNNPRLSFPVWKRIVDIALSSAGLIVLFPLLLLIAAIIKTVSRGPALLRQERVGRYGKTFGLWKFRTMHVGADAAPHRSYLEGLITRDIPMIKLDAVDDPRIFPFGKFLRRTCLDE